jgi:hypothetical protein
MTQEKALQALHSENERLGLYKDAYAQSEQEPVAWRNAAIRVGEGLCSVGPFEYYDMTAKQWLDWALSVVTVHTAPPQRTWVGLASEDRLTAKYMQDAPDGIEAVIDYIEAKLKEKNT